MKPMRSKPGPLHRERKTLATGKSAGKASWPADHVQRWPIERLVPYARNARSHDDLQISQIAASIREWGWTNPVLVAEDGTIIAGHGRVLAAQKAPHRKCAGHGGGRMDRSATARLHDRR
jgi:hypothetical protein